jgi:hypothetical protein
MPNRLTICRSLARNYFTNLLSTSIGRLILAFCFFWFIYSIYSYQLYLGVFYEHQDARQDPSLIISKVAKLIYGIDLDLIFTTRECIAQALHCIFEDGHFRYVNTISYSGLFAFITLPIFLLHALYISLMWVIHGKLSTFQCLR